MKYSKGDTVLHNGKEYSAKFDMEFISNGENFAYIKESDVEVVYR